MSAGTASKEQLPFDLTILRSFRVLRPLKLVSKVPSKFVGMAIDKLKKNYRTSLDQTMVKGNNLFAMVLYEVVKAGFKISHRNTEAWSIGFYSKFPLNKKDTSSK